MTSGFYVEDNSDIEGTKLNAAMDMYASGNYSGALKIYLDLINTSFSYKIYYEIGRCYYKLDDINNAEKYFLQSVDLIKDKNPSYKFLGNIFSKKNDINKAIEYWLTAYSYKPDDEAVCLNLGSSYSALEMNFQAITYYEKYLRYASDKTTKDYNEIKNKLSELESLSKDFYNKAKIALNSGDKNTAIKALNYAVEKFPTDFDTTYLLGKTYCEIGEYIRALPYIKLAYCMDTKSLDVLQKMSEILIKTNNMTGAYCCFKRMLPLVIYHQNEYLEVVQTINKLGIAIGNTTSEKHLEAARKYYSECDFHFSLLEYENCRIISGSEAEVDQKIEKLKSFLFPEDRIIKICMEKGENFYSQSNFKQANKYFTKIMSVSKPESSDYKYAKSRIRNA